MKRLKESTRKKLLESAIHEFSDHGFEGANIDTISVQAGFAKGTIYNYFKNKLDVFLAVIQESIGELAESIRESIKDFSSPEERLGQAITMDIKYIINNSRLVMAVFREAYVSDSERRQNFLKASESIFDLYRNLIVEGIKSRVFSKETNPVITAIAIMGICESLAFSNIEFGGALGSEDDIAEWILKFTFHGIKE